MIRFVAGSAIAAVLLSLIVVGTAAGQAPSGPRLAYTRDDYSPMGEELLTIGPRAAGSFLLYRHPDAHRTFGHISWSRSGVRLAFASHGSGLGERIYVVSAAGGPLREVSGTQFAFSPVFSPDGRTIAFARTYFRELSDGGSYRSTSIWLVDSRGGEPRRLTPQRDGLLLLPSSFSPDGTRLVAESLSDDEDPGFPDIVSVPLDGGPLSLVVEEGAEPAYSPDGTQIAFVRPRETGRIEPVDLSPVLGGDLFVVDADGSDPARLTYTPDRREVRPSWDPSGERLAFVQAPSRPTPAAQERGTGSSVMQINSDGSCPQRLLFSRGVAYREAVWQPGLGRGAGRIAC